DFRNTIIVMTSNIGAAKLTKQAAKIGFKLEEEATAEEKAYEEKRKEVIKELKANLRPEFINRIDHIIVFNALDQHSIRKIVKIHLDNLEARLKNKGFSIEVDQKAVHLLGELGFDPEYGARPVRRVIQERIEDEIAEHILKGIFEEGDTIRIVAKGKDRFDFLHGDQTKAKKEPKMEEINEAIS
ncbi:MAG: ATP-dependent Clp protease ATP-binding subunit, partial [Candidatus Peregrinibacteria bacterium]|nr:ATP-dependent Clp protease ATP-binding subunit [Candidatus Peregrinibacteria bacterium]